MSDTPDKPLDAESSEGKENKELTTPIKIQRVVTSSGQIFLTPITIAEAISKSAKRVKVLPNGKQVKDTTYFEERIKRLMRTDVKAKEKIGEMFGKQKDCIWEAEEYKVKKRKVENMELGSVKRVKTKLN